ERIAKDEGNTGACDQPTDGLMRVLDAVEDFSLGPAAATRLGSKAMLLGPGGELLDAPLFGGVQLEELPNQGRAVRVNRLVVGVDIEIAEGSVVQTPAFSAELGIGAPNLLTSDAGIVSSEHTVDVHV